MRFPPSIVFPRLAAAVFAAATVGCSAGLTDVPDPSTIIDPGVVRTQDGAIGLYRGAVTQFAYVFAGAPASSYRVPGSSYVLVTGLASDELTTDPYGSGSVDLNYMQRSVDPALKDEAQPYGDMHTARLYIDQAIGALRQYGKTTPPAFVGKLFALKGYLYIMFAELYCSGVPFSRAIYGGDLVQGSPETTQQMLEHAIAQFDTAIAVATDSASIRQLASVGKARALVDLGRFADAAAAVTGAAVPTSFSYALTYSADVFPNYFSASTYTTAGNFSPSLGALYMANGLGTNGLRYVDAGNPGSPMPDPRVAYTTATLPYYPNSTYQYPAQYTGGSNPVVLGSGIEARLIEAEAALQANEVAGWRDALNDLRASAGASAIPDLTSDSTTGASADLRAKVMFRERAFWLYGTGHRLGDLRRLIRQYHYPLPSVFPVGRIFPATLSSSAALLIYVNQPNFVPPQAEADANPLYTGCVNRDA